jgi:hypothetical protein
MKTLQVFLAVAAVMSGAILLIPGPEDVFPWVHAAIVFVAVMLLAGGITYLRDNISKEIQRLSWA